MARTIQRLSSATVRNAKAGMWPDGAGLYLQCTNGSDDKPRKCWIFRYANKRRDRQMGLGSLADVSLAEAREKAAACRRLRLSGIDPLDHRDSARMQAALEAAKAMSFDECRDAYIAAHASGWRNPKHLQQWKNTLESYCTPIFGEVSVQAVDVALIMKAIEPLWATKSETASRVRGRVEAVLDWAKVRGLRAGDNPARWRGHLDQLLPASAKVHKPKHHAALAYVEIGVFMTDLRGREGIAASALEFAILTAARTNEVLGAKWDELDENIWTVPASRMKAGREHRVPLNAAAMVVVERMRGLRRNDHLFPGSSRATLSNMALLATLRRMGRGGLTAHGFRSTFRTWGAERTSYPREVVEMALAHVVGTKVELAYQRGDLFAKRTRLMDAWAEECAKSAIVGAAVIPLRR